MRAVTVPAGNSYDKYGTTNRIERRLVGRFFDRFESLLPATAPRRVLEIGTGEGLVADRVIGRFPEAAFVALDLPHGHLAKRWQALDGHGVFATAERLPFPDGAFDLVLAVEVLEHLRDPALALGELARVATPGGTALLSVPSEPLWRALNLARGRYVRSLGNTPGHVQHWTPGAFTQLVGRWFDVSAVRHPVPWLNLAWQDLR